MAEVDRGQLEAFVEVVDRMRSAQRAYYAQRDQPTLLKAKQAEAEVDQALGTIRQTQAAP